jgi:hypothetical protein
VALPMCWRFFANTGVLFDLLLCIRWRGLGTLAAAPPASGTPSATPLERSRIMIQVSWWLAGCCQVTYTAMRSYKPLWTSAGGHPGAASWGRLLSLVDNNNQADVACSLYFGSAPQHVAFSIVACFGRTPLACCLFCCTLISPSAHITQLILCWDLLVLF